MDDHQPTGATAKKEYLDILAAGRSPVLDLGDGLEADLDFSPGLLERVPLTEVVEVVAEVLLPRLRAELPHYPPKRRRRLRADLVLAGTAANHPAPGSLAARFVVALRYWPRSGDAELVACLRDELQTPDFLWRPDLRDELRRTAADIQAGLHGLIEDN
jgi:hypothetical protein